MPDRTVFLRVTPGASRNAVGGVWIEPGGQRRLVVRVTTAPEKGKANDAVIKILARYLGVSKSSLTIEAGETDRNKRLRMTGLSDDAVARLNAAMSDE
ncbi:DUF167 domain-containing protein [Parvularcula sp. LCG005]|nr:DUF167 domain-containing protein [Parvularcula sp. LCG005]WOI53736.1 DUF167 domain-containing protein [Parvularcula sp. LCG005]